MKPFIKRIFFFHLSVFENKDKIVIVMEYASRGDLYDYICDKSNISERDARHFFRQIVSAVHYCHQVRLNPMLSYSKYNHGELISMCAFISCE